YSGLAIEFPLTIKNIDNANPQNDILNVEFLTEDVNIFPGYPGHRIVVRLYTPDPIQGNPYHWRETIIQDTDRIVDKAISTVVVIPIPANPTAIFISLAIEIETDIQPGLYDDFLFVGLNYTAQNNSIFARFGFE